MRISTKKIKELCGTVSYKKGESLYRRNKVIFTAFDEFYYQATVKGREDFQVSIRTGTKGNIEAMCSCPPIEGYPLSCQHVAAVLIAIREELMNEEVMFEDLSNDLQTSGLTKEFISLFDARKTRSSGYQIHFETREELKVQFTLTPVLIDENVYLFGLHLRVGQINVSDIRAFLKAISNGVPYELADNFRYDPEQYCFSSEDDTVFHHLIRVLRDETIFLKSTSHYESLRVNQDILLIPPSAWNGLMIVLKNAGFVNLKLDGQGYPFKILDEQPPIKFLLKEDGDNHYQLKLNGFEKILIFTNYGFALAKGKLYQLSEEDFERLVEMKRLLGTTNEDSIPISEGNLEYFLKKIIPRLKRIGKVQLSKVLLEKMTKIPLVAKIYLDRINHRLLAGLEFHYDQVVIQPLENREDYAGPVVVRDIEKEEEILAFMDESGFTKHEGGYFMQNEELEYEFLVHRLPKLQKLAQVYATTAVRNRVLSNTHPKIRVRIHRERTDWLEFKFEMDGVTDKQIKEILTSLELKRKYYRLPNGSILSLETREMEAIRKFLEAEPIQDDGYEATLDKPILESLKFLDMIQDEKIFTPEESFRKFIDRLLNPRSLDFEVPQQLDGVLRDYQKDGYKWMKALAYYGFGGVLADDMGLGKTIQSISYIVSVLKEIRNRNQPVLVVCPSSLTYNWFNEISRFAPEIEAIIVDGAKGERDILLENLDQVEVLITSYPLLRRDISWYKKQTFHTVFFDEAQNFKNPITQTARTVKQIQARQRLALTGTPIENSLEELWSIYHVVFPQLFQGLEEFSHLTREMVAKRVRPFLLRRTKEDVLEELPEKENYLKVSDLLPEQKQLYAAFLAKLRHETLKHLDRETFQKNKLRILAGLTRLRQICCHPALFVEGYKGRSAKFEQLMQILEEARLSDRRVLIFSQFTKMLDLIGRELTVRGQSYFYLDGQTPSEERVELCQRFNDGERDVFLISLKAGGTGLNLTGADTVILYDLWWNPAVEEQAADRAHRMGQKNSVQVIKLIARGTVEEKMFALQEKKRNLISDILDSDEDSATSLTEEDIREILMI